MPFVLFSLGHTGGQRRSGALSDRGSRPLILRAGFGIGAGPFLDSNVLRVLLLIGIFLFGCLEGEVFKHRDAACVKWFWGLVALTVWIGYPLTLVRICLGAIVLLSGVTLLVCYHRRWFPLS